MKVLRNVSPKSFSAEEKVYFKQHMHTEENLYCLSWHNLVQLCQTSKTSRWGNDTLKLTLIMTSQRKIMNRYLYLSLTLSAEDFKALANGRSRSSLSTPCNGRLPFVFRVTRRNVELFNNKNNKRFIPRQYPTVQRRLQEKKKKKLEN